MNTPLLPDERGYWEVADLKRLRERAKNTGCASKRSKTVRSTSSITSCSACRDVTS